MITLAIALMLMSVLELLIILHLSTALTKLRDKTNTLEPIEISLATRNRNHGYDIRTFSNDDYDD